jgi:hypothetical protein
MVAALSSKKASLALIKCNLMFLRQRSPMPGTGKSPIATWTVGSARWSIGTDRRTTENAYWTLG